MLNTDSKRYIWPCFNSKRKAFVNAEPFCKSDHEGEFSKVLKTLFQK